MTGYFQEITNPFTQGKGVHLSKIIKDLGDGIVYGELDLNSLPAWQRVQIEGEQKYNNLTASVS